MCHELFCVTASVFSPIFCYVHEKGCLRKLFNILGYLLTTQAGVRIDNVVLVVNRPIQNDESNHKQLLDLGQVEIALCE